MNRLLALWRRVSPFGQARNPAAICRLYIEGNSIAQCAKLAECSERAAMLGIIEAFPFVYTPVESFEDVSAIRPSDFRSEVA